MLDKEIRDPLFDYLDERYGKVRVIEEKIIGKSRADVLAIIEGSIIGMEIKSDNDTYTRLASQIKDYERYCDYCYVVAGESHARVAEHVPDYWGIIYVSPDNVIVERDAERSPKVKLENQLSLLWRNELLNIQEKEGLPKLLNTKRLLIYERLIKTAGVPTIRADVTEQLMNRDYTLWDDKSLKVKKKKKVIKRKAAANKSTDKSRAHVTNYVGKRKKKSKK